MTDPLAAFRLDDRVAVVTGASSGLGDRFARTLDAVGARVVLVARRRDRLETLAADLGGAVVIEADLADPESPQRVIDEALSRCGTVDVLVNNAGMSNQAPAIEEDPARFDRVVDVNLRAPYRLARATAAAAIGAGRPAAIVNVASILGTRAARAMPQAGYVASKAGLVGVTWELANQWARQGVRVNALAPGWFPTELSDPLFDTDRGQAYVRRYTPMGRGGELPELDGALLLLASDAGSFITGHTLVVDGGWTAV